MDQKHQKQCFDFVRQGKYNDLFAFLGAHQKTKGIGYNIRVFEPHAKTVKLLDSNLTTIGLFKQVYPECFLFQTEDASFDKHNYLLEVEYDTGYIEQKHDVYSFTSYLGSQDHYYFSEGSHFQSYEKFGAHHLTLNGVEGVHFCVWAPSALRVSLVGDFNFWDGRKHIMRKHPSSGLWDIFIPDMIEGNCYKYEIIAHNGERLPLKADPYAFQSELRPKTSSIVPYKEKHQWNDQKWMETRQANNSYDAPINIYEVHLGSWKRGDCNKTLSYRELAEDLIPYVKYMGYTHIELLPITEHPLDASWGYQPIGMFSPTSRFGTPNDLKYFIDVAHNNGIGVILDWVPAHFPEDIHGLSNFDGTCLYEHQDPRQARHKDWGTLIYNYERNEVKAFLISSALFWLDEYHIDGLRVDAVASMLYLDYSKKEGEWIKNIYGSNENLGAIEFLKCLNYQIRHRFPDTLSIAEESTSWYGVSKPVEYGGLGFHNKWNMGWMNDTLNYFQRDPIYRKHHHNDITFSLIYSFSENFIVNISHDEVVHGKGSLLNKMPGDDWQKFANLRALLGYMYAHPGKKLLYMGSEIGQWSEWDYSNSLDWHLLQFEPHQKIQNYVRSLNKLYLNSPPMHQLDYDHRGFAWVDCGDYEHSILIWKRYDKTLQQNMIFIYNFTPIVHHNYKVGFANHGRYKEVFNSDALEFGGSGVGNLGYITTEEVGYNDKPYSSNITIPPLSFLALQLDNI